MKRSITSFAVSIAVTATMLTFHASRATAASVRDFRAKGGGNIKHDSVREVESAHGNPSQLGQSDRPSPTRRIAIDSANDQSSNTESKEAERSNGDDGDEQHNPNPLIQGPENKDQLSNSVMHTLPLEVVVADHKTGRDGRSVRPCCGERR